MPTKTASARIPRPHASRWQRHQPMLLAVAGLLALALLCLAGLASPQPSLLETGPALLNGSPSSEASAPDAHSS